MMRATPKALTRLVTAGAQLVVLSSDILKALHIALEQVLDEETAKSEQFKRVLDRRYSKVSDVALESSQPALQSWDRPRC